MTKFSQKIIAIVEKLWKFVKETFFNRKFLQHVLHTVITYFIIIHCFGDVDLDILDKAIKLSK